MQGNKRSKIRWSNKVEKTLLFFCLFGLNCSLVHFWLSMFQFLKNIFPLIDQFKSPQNIFGLNKLH